MGFSLAIRQAIAKPGLLTAFLFMVGLGFAFFVAVAVQEWHSQAVKKLIDHPVQEQQAKAAEGSAPPPLPEQREPAP